MVTASGRPSGMATTMMVTASTNALTNPRVISTDPGGSSPTDAGCAHICTTNAMKVPILAPTPMYPINVAM